MRNKEMIMKTICEQCEGDGWYAVNYGPDGFDSICPCDYCDGLGVRDLTEEEQSIVKMLAAINAKGYTIGKDIKVLLKEFPEYAITIKLIHPSTIHRGIDIF